MIRRLILVPVIVAMLVAGCDRNEGRPPRADDAVIVKPQPSVIAVPVEADLGSLSKAIGRAIPEQLWGIDRADQVCVKSERVDLGIAKLKTPTIKCRIIGSVTRGALTITGAGRDINVAIPLKAVVRAEDIGGVLKRETATADAIAYARIRLDLARDWTPTGTIDLTYKWTTAPHIEFLGQRIDLTQQADQTLKPIVAQLERDLPGELGKLKLRSAIEEAWVSAFTTLVLNEAAPPVWMRVTPRELQYGGYEIVDGRLRLKLGMRALTATHVGRRPKPKKPTPLPDMQPLSAKAGNLTFFIPVFADYRQLEPVLIRALRKRAKRPFSVPGLNPVWAKFRSAEIYGTKNGHVAVGLTFTAHEQGSKTPTSGTVWMTGKPINAKDSRQVGFGEFNVTGTTDMTGGDLILDLINAPGIADMVADLLSQDFERDYVELLTKVDGAIAEKNEGAIVIRADLKRVRTGQLQAAGKGLYMPVWASGTASITVRQ